MDIPFNNLLRGYKYFKTEYENKALEVLNSGHYILGKEVLLFEKEFKEAIKGDYCIGVDNGLNAIRLGLKALEIGKGDEVILQANSYIATVLGVLQSGAKPIFVEPDEFFNIDSKKIECRININTKAVLITHLYGQATKMDKIIDICSENKVHLLEDCAQAHFAKYNNKTVGTFGTMGFFSFYPTKILGSFGDAGAIITNNSQMDSKLRKLRNYGIGEKYNSELIGFNSRLDEIQAGFLRIKLKYIDILNKERESIANEYLLRIKNEKVALPKIQKGCTHVWHLFVVRTENRDYFRDYLKQNKISTEIHYPIPPHLSKAYQSIGYEAESFPQAEKFANTVVSLPLFIGMENLEIDKVINVINDFI